MLAKRHCTKTDVYENQNLSREGRRSKRQGWRQKTSDPDTFSKIMCIHEEKELKKIMHIAAQIVGPLAKMGIDGSSM